MRGGLELLGRRLGGQQEATLTYRLHATLPAYVLADQDDTGKTTNKGSAPIWSGIGKPPAIGETVEVKINERGRGAVRSYFVESGWLGVLVDLEAPPATYLEQCDGNPPCHVFGAELTVLPPTGAEGHFSEDQLAVLRAAYRDLRAIDPVSPTYSALTGALDGLDNTALRQLAKADVRFISALSLNRCIRRGC